jgi:tetratricopeptide (TPR) repeat protein
VGTNPAIRYRYVLALAQAGRREEAARIYHGAFRNNLGLYLQQTPPRPSGSVSAAELKEIVTTARLYLATHGSRHDPASSADPLRHLKEVLRTQPSSAEAHFRYGLYLAYEPGREKEALAELDKAEALGGAAMKQRVRRQPRARGLRGWWYYHSRGLPEPAPLPVPGVQPLPEPPDPEPVPEPEPPATK